MDNAEYFSYHIKLLAENYRKVMGVGMQELEEAAMLRSKEANDLGLPELRDPGLEDVEEAYGKLMADVHSHYVLLENSRPSLGLGSNARVDEHTDGSLTTGSRGRPGNGQALLFQDGFATFLSIIPAMAK